MSGSTSATIDETPLVYPQAAMDCGLLTPIALIVLLLVFYAILGCVLEGMSSIVMPCPSRCRQAGGSTRSSSACSW